MALVHVTRRIDADPQRVWQLVTDWPAQSRWIPLTRVFIDPDGPSAGVGTRFTGRTGLGPLFFDDLMEVTEWQPPADGAGRCRVVHRGRWVRGWAEITVVPAAGGGAQLTWLEDIRPRWTPRLADPVVAGVGRVLFDGTLAKLAGELSG